MRLCDWPYSTTKFEKSVRFIKCAHRSSGVISVYHRVGNPRATAALITKGNTGSPGGGALNSRQPAQCVGCSHDWWSLRRTSFWCMVRNGRSLDNQEKTDGNETPVQNLSRQ